jgi:endo-1,4-beta-xylanase
MKSVSALVAGICLSAAAFQAQAADEPVRLRDASEGLFLIGTALPTRAFSDLISTDIVAQDFNRLTCENEMKFDATEPQEGQFNFRGGDTLVEFAQKYNMKVHGHTFLWHSQTPQWVFQNPNDGRPLRDVVLARLENHIRALMTHWKGKIDSWDVCNECFEDDGRVRAAGGFGGNWRAAIGDDYMEQAFRIADKVAKELGEEKVLLVYNDFNMYKPGKVQAVVKMVNDFKAKGIRIDAIGMQAHWQSNDDPSIETIEAAFKAYAGTGCKIIISEMDINTRNGFRNSGLGLTRDDSVQGNADASAEALAKRYGELFDLFVKYRNDIHAVTVWGLDDGTSWLRGGQPLLFSSNDPKTGERGITPKPCYYSVLESMKKGQAALKK